MTGIPDFNYPAFNQAAERWASSGWKVFNPATHSAIGVDQMDPDEARALFMKKDIEWVMDADAVAVLPGWQKSVGASVEVSVARVLLHPVYDAISGELWAESAVQEAQRLVHGDRGANYGHPIDDFGRTGRLWAAILGLPEAVAPEMVGLCMAAVKISREVNKPSRDNRVDLAGYAETIEMIHQRRAAK